MPRLDRRGRSETLFHASQRQSNYTSAFKWLIRRSDGGDESMPKIQDILDETFSLLQQQMQVRSGSIPAAQAQEYQKRAVRIDQLLSSLSTQNRVGMAVKRTAQEQKTVSGEMCAEPKSQKSSGQM